MLGEYINAPEAGYDDCANFQIICPECDNLIFNYEPVTVNHITWSGYCYKPEHANRTPELYIWDLTTESWIFIAQKAASDSSIKGYLLSINILSAYA